VSLLVPGRISVGSGPGSRAHWYYVIDPADRRSALAVARRVWRMAAEVCARGPADDAPPRPRCWTATRRVRAAGFARPFSAARGIPAPPGARMGTPMATGDRRSGYGRNRSWPAPPSCPARPARPARPIRSSSGLVGERQGAPSAIRQKRTRLVLQPAVASRQRRRRRMCARWCGVCGLIHVLFCARTTLVFSTTRGRFTRLCLEFKNKNNFIK
jgi:hypothetical protein